MVLDYNDYINILDYYNIKIPMNKLKLKSIAEKILTRKLCSCIKTLEPKYNSRAIPICTNSILNKKGFTRGKFNCKTNTIKISRKKSKKAKNGYTRKVL